MDYIEEEFLLTAYGQIQHTIEADTPNHLFASLASTLVIINMNIVDQTCSEVEQADPLHDLGIGLIQDIIAQYMREELHLLQSSG